MLHETHLFGFIVPVVLTPHLHAIRGNTCGAGRCAVLATLAARAVLASRCTGSVANAGGAGRRAALATLAARAALATLPALATMAVLDARAVHATLTAALAALADLAAI